MALPGGGEGTHARIEHLHREGTLILSISAAVFFTTRIRALIMPVEKILYVEDDVNQSELVTSIKGFFCIEEDVHVFCLRCIGTFIACCCCA